jgi:hypothetical protein
MLSSIMTTTALFGWLLLAAGGWFWYDSMRALERARQAGRQHCGHMGVVLLDDTVVLTRLRPARDAAGRWTLHREYQFEFTGDGRSRHGGEITLIGGRVESLITESYREDG